ncbi:MAG: LysM peptidoglycan-binding domain-containing protein [Treponema sp.]|nr:LysM peptidoglycan-binding domain-containing protein [Treponema sp.]
MIRKLTIALIICLAISIPAFSAADNEDFADSLRNNEYFLESVRLTKLAHETFEYGDYDASAGFAEEAIRYAELSDEYVATHLIAEADRLLKWADNNNIPARFPNNYEESKNQYEIAVAAYSDEEWNDSIEAAIKAIEILAAFESTGRPAVTTTTGSGTTGTGTSSTTTTTTTTGTSGTRQYTVRTWRVERDCLWNIAGYSWVYGDPWRWRDLYEANKSRMPDPDNPDLIEPGMVLEIPR